MSSDEETSVALSSSAGADDPLLRSFRELPVHASKRDTAHDAAREAFVRASDASSGRGDQGIIDLPALVTVGGGIFRGATAIVLAGIVGLYLSWAFAVAIALNQ